MPEYTGTIDQFMIDNESLINSLIQEKISEQLADDKVEIEIKSNEIIKKRVEEVKENLADLFRAEFQDWIITLDTQAFATEFMKHFHLSEDELKKVVFQ